MLAAALLLAAAQLPPPRTVNGEVLGPAEKYTTAGPARVCMDRLMITALRGESVTLGYSGIHNGSLRLNRGGAWVDAALGDIWAGPEEIDEVVDRRAGSYIADASSDTQLRYGLFAPADNHSEYRLLGWIDGPAFVGDQRDLSVLRRIELRGPQSPPCDVTYHYGWPVLLGDQPLVERHK